MDIAQMIFHVQQNNIDGDIAEFGSFKGHSGYLITSLVNALKIKKKVFLFDMFESFPSEEIGIDAFWSDTHLVNFDDVKRKFTDIENVKLVKGDFTQTLKNENINSLSFIHVDCDSFRATKFLMEELFERVLSKGGVIVFEDYGHAGLLGNRVAVENYFNGRTDCFKFFSQFSGYFIVYKK